VCEGAGLALYQRREGTWGLGDLGTKSDLGTKRSPLVP
jgi:hypothetical protein